MAEPISPAELAAWREAEAKASKAPWEASWRALLAQWTITVDGTANAGPWLLCGPEDAGFIALARTAFPRLLAEAEEAAKCRAEIASLKEQLEGTDATLEDEETSHQETLLLWEESKAEVGRLRKAIESFGNNPAGFDWAVLSRIEELEAEVAEARKNIDAHKALIQAMLYEAIGDADIDTEEQAVEAIRSVVQFRDGYASETHKLRDENQELIRSLQRIQPGGSPPPGGPVMLADWITRSVGQELDRLKAENAAMQAKILDEQADFILERWDQTDKDVQRAIAASLVLKLSEAREAVEKLRTKAQEIGDKADAIGVDIARLQRLEAAVQTYTVELKSDAAEMSAAGNDSCTAACARVVLGIAARLASLLVQSPATSEGAEGK